MKCRMWQKNISLENKHVCKLFYIYGSKTFSKFAHFPAHMCSSKLLIELLKPRIRNLNAQCDLVSKRSLHK